MQHVETTSAPLVHRIPQACARIGIGRTALYQLLRDGELRAVKLGGRTLIPESELQRLVAQRLQAAA